MSAHPTIIYKILPAAIWAEAEAKGVFGGAGIDLVDGFIHFSTADQVAQTAALHFAEQADLLLVAVDTDGLEIVWEESRGGMLFPHLYEDLPLSAVCKLDPMPLGDNGLHQFPADIPPLKSAPGFAIVLALIIVAMIAIITTPLLVLVERTAGSSYEQRVSSHLSHEARENLELGVYLTKIAGGPPNYFTAVTSAESIELATACERRLQAINSDQLNGHSLTDNVTTHAPVTISATRKTGLFVVNKGTEQDSRYDRYLVVSCALGTKGELGLLTSELASLTGSYFTLNLNEY